MQWSARPCASTSGRCHCERARAVQQPAPALPAVRHPGAPWGDGLRPPRLLRRLRRQPLDQGDVRRVHRVSAALVYQRGAARLLGRTSTLAPRWHIYFATTSAASTTAHATPTSQSENHEYSYDLPQAAMSRCGECRIPQNSTAALQIKFALAAVLVISVRRLSSWHWFRWGGLPLSLYSFPKVSGVRGLVWDGDERVDGKFQRTNSAFIGATACRVRHTYRD